MLIRSESDPQFMDLALPDVFVTAYLPRLEGTAVKLYLCLLHCQARALPFELSEAVRLLQTTEDDIKAALLNLQLQGLLFRPAAARDELVLRDLKKQPETELNPEEAVRRMTADPKRQDVVDSINKSFFNGIMGLDWYHLIDVWFETYQFKPEVMYTLFSEAYQSGKLKRSYVSAVAKSWHERGIKTYEDRKQDQAQHEAKNSLGRQVSRSLNQGPLTAAQEQLVSHWATDYGYDMDIIRLALAKATQTPKASLNYFDKILKEWHEAGLKTAEAVNRYEENRRAKQLAKRPKNAASGARKGSNVANFKQRQYSDDFFRQFEEDPRFLLNPTELKADSHPAEAQPDPGQDPGK
ncbi:DnaD domain protein [Oscillospiraceae bacterium HV4-5-C5C]|nr:DnaD domain protein [Oscillospiraceae bacterium HV4-5-C5C]